MSAIQITNRKAFTTEVTENTEEHFLFSVFSVPSVVKVLLLAILSRAWPAPTKIFDRTFNAISLQTDMKIFATLILSLALSAANAAVLPTYSTHYDPKRDAFADGRDALNLAATTQRKVLIEVGGNWCAWCYVLDQFLQENVDIQNELQKTFVVLKINVSDANDNAVFLKAFPKPLGYPHMYITDSGGKILWSQDTAEFLQNGKFSRQRIQAFITKWKQHEQQ